MGVGGRGNAVFSSEPAHILRCSNPARFGTFRTVCRPRDTLIFSFKEESCQKRSNKWGYLVSFRG